MNNLWELLTFTAASSTLAQSLSGPLTLDWLNIHGNNGTERWSGRMVGQASGSEVYRRDGVT